MNTKTALGCTALLISVGLAAACSSRPGSATADRNPSDIASGESSATTVESMLDTTSSSTTEATLAPESSATPATASTGAPTPRVSSGSPTAYTPRPPAAPPSTAPGTTAPPVPQVWVITCPDGTRHEFDHPPTFWEELVCDRNGIRPPAPPPTTLPPTPKVVAVSATYGAGLQWMSGGIASPETCPASTTIRYSITTEDGSVTSGSVGISGPSGEAVVTLASGRIVKFTYNMLPGGGCLKGILR